jgi:hypothetical protein
MVDQPNDVSYPDRPSLIADMCSLLKAARRPLTEEWKRFDLDREGWNLLDRLTDRLVHHLHFEHLGRKELRRTLHDAVRRYKNASAGQRPANAQFAADVLDGLAQQPMRRTVFSFLRTTPSRRALPGAAAQHPSWCVRSRRSAALMTCC